MERGALSRTIEEAKGLEYDIVIVYNFFSESKFYSLWDKLFREDNLTESENVSTDSKLELEKLLLKENLKELINSLGLENLYINNTEDEIKAKIINELRNMKYPHLKKGFDIHSNFEFCSELKQFYVIITRPRTFLLFYEEKANEYFQFFDRMIKNGMINYISDDSFIEIIMDFYRENKMICENIMKHLISIPKQEKIHLKSMLKYIIIITF